MPSQVGALQIYVAYKTRSILETLSAGDDRGTCVFGVGLVLCEWCIQSTRRLGGLR